MSGWEPQTPFDDALMQARLAGDDDQILSLLRGTELALPISPAAADGLEPPRWATAGTPEQTFLLAYTSVEAMQAGTNGEAQHCRVAALPEIMAGYPDPRWALAVNPGLPIEVLLPSQLVARLAAAPIGLERAADPEFSTPLVQKAVSYAEVEDFYGGRLDRISGYVHNMADVAHIGSPSVLLKSLGATPEETDDLLMDNGSLLLLRWPAIGDELYPTPYGGTDAELAEAMGGKVIEEAPFLGTGFARNPDVPVREYKLDGVALPYGAEITELDTEGGRTRRSVWDADRETWLMVFAQADYEDVLAEDRADAEQQRVIEPGESGPFEERGGPR